MGEWGVWDGREVHRIGRGIAYPHSRLEVREDSCVNMAPADVLASFFAGSHARQAQDGDGAHDNVAILRDRVGVGAVDAATGTAWMFSACKLGNERPYELP